ncbi:MAG: DUF2490 domain-containing protein [Pseudomonadota bacterium]
MRDCIYWSLAALAMVSPVAASAQEEDTQLWVYAVASAPLGDRGTLSLDATARWRERARGDEQQTLRANLLHPIAEGVRIGGGGGLFETEGGDTEIRPHQEVDLKFGRFSARTRVEQRFFDGAERVEIRLRQLVRYALPISNGIKMSIDGEYLGLAQTRERTSEGARDQWRARLIASADVSGAVTLGVGYLAIHTPQPGREDQLNHVPQLYLTSRF